MPFYYDHEARLITKCGFRYTLELYWISQNYFVVVVMLLTQCRITFVQKKTLISLVPLCFYICKKSVLHTEGHIQRKDGQTDDKLVSTLGSLLIQTIDITKYNTI